MAEPVALTDLRVIQEYSLALFKPEASRDALIALLREDLAWLEAGCPGASPTVGDMTVVVPTVAAVPPMPTGAAVAPPSPSPRSPVPPAAPTRSRHAAEQPARVPVRRPAPVAVEPVAVDVPQELPADPLPPSPLRPRPARRPAARAESSSPRVPRPGGEQASPRPRRKS
jgi:hypothetical protein